MFRYTQCRSVGIKMLCHSPLGKLWGTQMLCYSIWGSWGKYEFLSFQGSLISNSLSCCPYKVLCILLEDSVPISHSKITICQIDDGSGSWTTRKVTCPRYFWRHTQSPGLAYVLLIIFPRLNCPFILEFWLFRSEFTHIPSYAI